MIKLLKYLFNIEPSRKSKHKNYVGSRIYELTYDIRCISLSLDRVKTLEKYKDLKNPDKAICSDIRFKLSLIRKYQRYLRALRA